MLNLFLNKRICGVMLFTNVLKTMPSAKAPHQCNRLNWFEYSAMIFRKNILLLYLMIIRLLMMKSRKTQLKSSRWLNKSLLCCLKCNSFNHSSAYLVACPIQCQLKFGHVRAWVTKKATPLQPYSTRWDFIADTSLPWILEVVTSEATGGLQSQQVS